MCECMGVRALGSPVEKRYGTFGNWRERSASHSWWRIIAVLGHWIGIKCVRYMNKDPVVPCVPMPTNYMCKIYGTMSDSLGVSRCARRVWRYGSWRVNGACVQSQ